MRKLYRAIMALPLLILSVSVGFAQDTQTQEQHQPENSTKPNITSTATEGSLHYLTFTEIPDQNAHRALSERGIQLISYHTNRTYLAYLPAGLSTRQLELFNVQSSRPAQTEDKLSSTLRERQTPEWAQEVEGQIDLAVNFHLHTLDVEMANFLAGLHANILEDNHRGGKTKVIRLPEAAVQQLTASSLVAYVDYEQEPMQMLNHEVQLSQRVNIMKSNLSGGFGLSGTGVTVGVGDGGELGDHIDFGTRVINKANGTYSSFGDHGDHVSGIIGGAGNLNPRHQGVAPTCQIITQKTSLITYNTEAYYNDYGMVLTNNSYGTSFNCATNGSYNYSAQTLDWQMREYPSVLHVFAAGNSGGGQCDPYPQGYHTVLRYYQSAKNVLTVGNVGDDRVIASNSSRGPVKDGRIKPEIVGIGKNVYSTSSDFNYVIKAGTSMAAPAVTGTLALLVEQYRDQHNGNDPDGALLKAVACNTAEDLGNPGPDYLYGYGLINGLRAARVIENNQFQNSVINQGETQTFDITVPSGTKQVKVMLYWHDKEAEVYPDKALVNNLDMELISPSGESFLPWVLNADPNHVADPAVRGVDDLNNIEQVTIDNPTSGTYTLRVDGTEIPFANQSYYITYEFIQEEVVVTYPFGGESLTPGLTEMVQWEADITNTETFKVEYSIDGGGTWLMIHPAVEADQRCISWTVPQVSSEIALIRVTKNGSGINATNNIVFNILAPPTELNSEAVCQKMVQLDWTAPEYDVVNYEIIMHDGEEMIAIGNTSETTYLVDADLEIGVQYWFSVRAQTPAGHFSQRISAKYAVPEDIEICPWEDDPIVAEIASALLGRAMTSNSLGDDEVIKTKVVNIGANAISDIELYYSINGGAPVAEVYNGVITSGDSLEYTFNTTADLSAGGVYDIAVWVEMDGDTHEDNNSMSGHQVIQLHNNAIALPFSQYFGQQVGQAWTENKMGIDAAGRWDFYTQGQGQADFTADGALALRPINATSSAALDNHLVMTLNLSDFADMSTPLGLSFKYRSEPMTEDVAVLSYSNALEIRGSDTEEWIEVLVLDEQQMLWKNIQQLQLTNILEANGQSFSSSAQLRLTQRNTTSIIVDQFQIVELEDVAIPISEVRGTQQGGDVMIEWVATTIDSEISFFEIQLGDFTEGTNDNFEILETITATVSGTATQPITYHYLDTQPGKKGDRYYRLRQVNADGTYAFSPVIRVAIEELVMEQPFPNPFHQRVALQYDSQMSQSVRLQLLDHHGRLLQEQVYPVGPGRQYLALNTLPELVSGWYHLRVIDAEGSHTYPLVKQ